jgi:hypothetical protein
LISRRTGVWVSVGFTIAAAAAAVLAPPIPQPQSYHDFADQRALLGIANFRDVASNLLFAVSGAWGLVFLFGQRGQERFIDPRERWAYVLVFPELVPYGIWVGLLPSCSRQRATSVGPPADDTGLHGLGVGNDFGKNERPSRLLFASRIVAHRRGAGDLRFYAAVQVYAVLLLPVLLLLPPRYTPSRDFAVVFTLYVLAKVFETLDRQSFTLGQHAISGHTLKHLAAGIAGFWILRMLQKETADPSSRKGESPASTFYR